MFGEYVLPAHPKGSRPATCIADMVAVDFALTETAYRLYVLFKGFRSSKYLQESSWSLLV